MLKVTVLKIHGPSLYITENNNNVALFPAPDGHFSLIDLTPRGHYEVHGEGISAESSPNTPVTPSPTRFFFHRPVSAAAGSATGSSAAPRATMPKKNSKVTKLNNFSLYEHETTEYVTQFMHRSIIVYKAFEDCQ